MENQYKGVNFQEGSRRGCCERPRRGQALLLAVLLMLFVALLGATFVTVVALNLQQTARGEDKTRAQNAAQAGLRYVNNQLTNSPDGPQWFVKEARQEAGARDTATADDAMQMLASDMNKRDYYTSFDRAQGWAGKFLKFPNQLAPQTSDTPTFLARVEIIGAYNSLTDSPPDNRDNSKTGDFRITVIGLSPDNSAAFAREVSYKPGPRHSPFTSVMRAVSNHVLDAGNNGSVPTAVLNTAMTSGVRTMNLSDVKGVFPQAPFYIVIGGPQTNTPARGALVVSATYNSAGTPLTFVLSRTATSIRTSTGGALPQAGERIELAVALGETIQPPPGASNRTAFSKIDYLNTAAKTDDAPLTFNVSETSALGGIWANGGLYLQGTAKGILQTPSTITGAPFNYSGRVIASSLIAIDKNTAASGSTINVDPAVVTISGTYDLGSGSAGTVNNVTLTSSSSDSTGAAVFPWATPVAPSMSPAQKDQLVSDGWYRIARETGNPGASSGANGTRQNRPFLPPDITGGTNGVGRYREMSKFSPSTTGGSDASLYGYGQGIYVDNSDDIEKVYDPTSTRLRPMTANELQAMWISLPIDDVLPNSNAVYNYTRYAGATVNPQGTPIPAAELPPSAAAATATNASLEQKHLRGWVGADEFRARGTLIELDPKNKQVVITRDARSDANPLGPDVGKSWRDASGQLLNSNKGGVYRLVKPWPTNGVIFCEGNARVRGGVEDPENANTTDPVDNSTIDPGNSITIVSQNNIYIEGSLNAGGSRSVTLANGTKIGRKVLLLARKNVVCNPTALVQRPDEQTVVTNAAANATTLNVADTGNFQVGDVVGVTTLAPINPLLQVPVQSARITTIVNNTRFNISNPVDVAANSTVRTLGDRDDPTNAPAPLNFKLYSVNQNTLDATTQALQRRFYVPPTSNATAPIRISLRHAALRRDALTATTAQQPTTAVTITTATLANKLTGTAGVPAATILAAQNVFTTGIQDTSNPTPGYTETFPNTPSINTLLSSTTGNTTGDFLVDNLNSKYPDPTAHWMYQVAFQSSLTPAQQAALSALPFYALAGVGNRKDAQDPTKPDPTRIDPTKQDIGKFPTTPFPGWRKNIAPGIPLYPLPLATSVDVGLNGSPASMMFSPSQAPTEYVNTFGFGRFYGDNEDTLTSDQTFYAVTIAGTPAFTLDGRLINAPATQSGRYNSLTLQPDATLSTLNPVSGANYMPSYYLSRFKLENADLITGFTAQVKPATTMDMRAYVYAQEGSWFVVPCERFDSNIKAKVLNTPPSLTGVQTSPAGYYYDFNGDGTPQYNEYVVSATGVAIPDLNRDGNAQPEEAAALNRFLRYNYQINFTGSILENQTAIVVSEGTVSGAVEVWTDSWATVTGNTPPTTANTAKSITYTFDPAVAQNPDAYITGPNADPGFQYPVTAQLDYQGSS